MIVLGIFRLNQLTWAMLADDLPEYGEVVGLLYMQDDRLPMHVFRV